MRQGGYRSLQAIRWPTSFVRLLFLCQPHWRQSLVAEKSWRAADGSRDRCSSAALSAFTPCFAITAHYTLLIHPDYLQAVISDSFRKDEAIPARFQAVPKLWR